MQTALASPSTPSGQTLPAFDQPTYLMCPPQFYDVNYVINPWMAGNLHRPSRDRAFAQWRSLYEHLQSLADVRVLPAVPGSPDMVFIAHTAVIQHGVAALSSFAHPERQAEEQHLRRWLEAAGFLLWETPRETSFEGEGDAVFDPRSDLLWAAHGVRTCHSAHRHLAAAWHTPVRSLHLVDPRFYHLDTCFATLSGGEVLYFPDAFDAASRRSIEAAFPPALRIPVSQAEATRFACNVINIGDAILMNHAGPALTGRLAERGYRVTSIDLSEFLRGGGAAKSMVLRLSDSSPSPQTLSHT